MAGLLPGWWLAVWIEMMILCQLFRDICCGCHIVHFFRLLPGPLRSVPPHLSTRFSHLAGDGQTSLFSLILLVLLSYTPCSWCCVLAVRIYAMALNKGGESCPSILSLLLLLLWMSFRSDDKGINLEIILLKMGVSSPFNQLIGSIIKSSSK